MNEPFYGSIAMPVRIASVERTWACYLMTPGALLFALGMLLLNVGIMLGGVSLFLTLLGSGALFCKDNAYALSDLVDSLFDQKYFVPEPGLRGKDGV